MYTFLQIFLDEHEQFHLIEFEIYYYAYFQCIISFMAFTYVDLYKFL